MNKAILMGRLTKDPEVRYSQSAEPIAVVRYTLAVNRRFKRDNEPDADFIPCVVFGRAAEFAERYLKKGMMLAISGRIQVRSWDDQATGQKRWSTEIVVEEQDFAESKASFEGRAGNSSSNQSYTPANNQSQPNHEPEGFSAISESIDDEDLPF